MLSLCVCVRALGANSPMRILIRVLIQKNVKLDLAADWEEMGYTDRGNGWTERDQSDSQRHHQNDTVAGMKDR